MSFGHATLDTATKFLVRYNFNQMIWLGQQIIWVIQPNIFKSVAGKFLFVRSDTFAVGCIV